MSASSTVFSRTQRLTKGAEYTRVFRNASRSSDRFFTVLASPNELAGARLGLAISRRAAPHAVDRNRLRRLARESFRHLELTSLDYVVMARKDAVSADNRTLSRSLVRHFGGLSERAAQK